jgi:hypothetical protein
MAVMAREAWTDERLDDLAKRMDKGFDEVKGEICELRGQIAALNARLDSMQQTIAGVQQTMVIGFISLFVSIAAVVIGGMIAAITMG